MTSRTSYRIPRTSNQFCALSHQPQYGLTNKRIFIGENLTTDKHGWTRIFCERLAFLLIQGFHTICPYCRQHDVAYAKTIKRTAHRDWMNCKKAKTRTAAIGIWYILEEFIQANTDQKTAKTIPRNSSDGKPCVKLPKTETQKTICRRSAKKRSNGGSFRQKTIIDSAKHTAEDKHNNPPIMSRPSIWTSRQSASYNRRARGARSIRPGWST